jgi:acetylornithine deacetylase/succinyl-diaminopimelate desuccinylase-like protein
MLSGATDAKHVARLGTHCLGFGPVRIPEVFPAEQLVHGHDERIPVDGYLWACRYCSISSPSFVADNRTEYA